MGSGLWPSRGGEQNRQARGAPKGSCQRYYADETVVPGCMSSAWHKTNPSLFEKEKAEVEAAYPNLYFHIENDLVIVRGTLPVVHEGKDLDRYAIEIALPRDYPRSLPAVRETGGRIP